MFDHLRPSRKWAAACLLAGLYCAPPPAVLAQDFPLQAATGTGLTPPTVETLPPAPSLPGEEAASAGTLLLPPPPDGTTASPSLPLASPPSTTPAPSTGGSATPAAAKDSPPKPKFWWDSVPPYTPAPRAGMFLVPPSGPGYYSLLDWLTGNYQEAPPKYPYPRFFAFQFSMFDADWRYLDNPKNTEHDVFDPLKRILLWDDNLIFTTGGEIRYRYNNEVNSRLSGVNNVYDLLRTRVYGDLMIGDRLRLFAEYIDAQSYHQDLPELATDVNHSDFLNLFADINLFCIKDHPLWFRVGRQEMIFESQRLVSPSDWGNTRRPFQGGKLFYRGDKWNVDIFCVQPVIVAPTRFDSVDNQILFSGIIGTYKVNKTQNIDAWYYNLDNSAPIFRGRLGELGGQNVSTLGGRYSGIAGNWLFDVWGSLQFGGYSNQSLLTKAFTTGGGYVFKDLPMNPQVWVYYDYASGDPNPETGNIRQTFDQLFPFSHYYFGYIDVVGRRNINDIMTQVALYPTPWLTTYLQYHVFRLDSPRDALYGANGAPLRQDITGQAGVNVGQELDFVVNFHLSKHQDVLINYSHLFAGDFIHNTARNAAQRRSPEYLYVQYTFRW